MRICFATNNKHKLEEAKDIANGYLDIVSLEEINCFEELPETRPTLEGNSLQKAQYVFEKYNTACFADDTGLEIDALNGEPGVYSARYAGEHKNSNDNIELVLKRLWGISNRKAQFRTIITLVGIDQRPVIFDGAIQGLISNTRQGEGGFGYDPIFIPDGYNRTFGEMTLHEKSSLSHRSLAMNKLGLYLRTKTISQ